MSLDDNSQDICRVCRSEGTPDKPLFHPCYCMGSIKHIHQDCLVQWLKFSKKEFCELCNYKFSFIPIYSADMPNRLPIKDILYGLLSNLGTAIKYWLHYSIVAIAWLVLVPSLSYRVIKCLFSGSFYQFITLPIDILAYDKLITEEIYGFVSVMITVLTVIAIIWLREIVLREIPDWLGNDQPQENQQANPLQNNAIQPLDHDLNALVNDPALNEQAVDHVAEEAIEAVNDVVEMQVEDNNNEVQVAQDEDVNWNPNEEISFERIFGLDGSLMFLEHIVWIVSLNVVFVFVFAFCPYQIGLFCLSKLDLTLFEFEEDGDRKLEKVLVTFIGYLIIGLLLVVLHYALFKFNRVRRLFGISYLIVKVGVVTVLEIGIFPIICGWLLGIFSLPLFGSTIYDRESFFKASPGISTLIHWGFGFWYIFCVTSFLLVLKDILKPSLVSFIESLNNPDYSPVQEIIHLSVFHIIRRYIMYLIFFVLLTFFMIFLPVNCTVKLVPGFLPYQFLSNGTHENRTETDGYDLPLEVWKIHIITPLLYDYSHLRNCLRLLIRHLCVLFAYLLDLKAFLLRPEEELNEENVESEDESNDEENNETVQAPNEPLLAGQQTGERQAPSYLYLRLLGLSGLICGTIFLFGLLMTTVPVFVGRRTIGLFVSEPVSDSYTITCGLYIIILNIKCVNLMVKWLPRGWAEISVRLKDVLLMFTKTITAAILLCGFLPLLIGFLFEVILFVPMRVPSNQTPIYYPIQDWLLGILLIKAALVIAILNEWNLRETLEEFYQAGFVIIDLKKIITKFIFPIVLAVSLVLSVPYVLVHGILSCFSFSAESLNLILRKCYLAIWCASALAYVLQWQFMKFCKLYEHIKNEKYLVGRKLINFEGNRAKQEQAAR